ncbi:ROK family protein [Candidatus Woesearchaeota archaeon]|nr:ROK family protein [Candidatus Woesearchaeota archaeon]
MEREDLIGVDLGGTKIEAGLVDLNGKVIKKLIMPTEANKGKAKVIENIVYAVNKLKRDRILGVGVGIPGPTDYRRGIAINPPNLPGWNEVPLKKILEEKLKLTVAVENDAKCFAIAEYKCGYEKKVSSLVGVTVGTGVGAGIIINGKLYRGASDSAGEIGHMTIVENGVKCSCGGKGCLEMYASGRAIERMYYEKTKKKLSAEQIADLMKKNKKAREVIDIAAQYLGIGLANLILAVNPEIVVVDGSIALIKGFVAKAEKEAQKHMKIVPKPVKIEHSKTEEAGILGAASIVF